MNKDFDLYVDVRDQECPNPMIKVNIVSQVLEKGEVLKVIINNEFSYKNIKNLIQSKKEFILIEEVDMGDGTGLYIKKID